MTPAEQSAFDSARARRQEAQDLADIAELGRTQGFNRYYVRRLKAKRETLEKSFKYDAMSHEARENVRQKILVIEEIEKMPATDSGSIKAAEPRNARSQ